MILVAKVWMFIHPQLCFCVCILKNWTIIVSRDFMGKRIPSLRSQRQKWTFPLWQLLPPVRAQKQVTSHNISQKLYSSGTAIWRGQSTVPKVPFPLSQPLSPSYSFLNTIHPFPYYVLYTCGKLPIHRIWYSG